MINNVLDKQAFIYIVILTLWINKHLSGNNNVYMYSIRAKNLYTAMPNKYTMQFIFIYLTREKHKGEPSLIIQVLT